MRFFKTQENFPIMANHDRPNDIEISESEYNSLVETKNAEAELAKAAMEQAISEQVQTKSATDLKIEKMEADIVAIKKALGVE